MFFPAFFFGPILLLLLLVAIVAVVVAVARRRPGDLAREEADRGIGTVKRLYFYGVAFVAFGVAANGAVRLIQYLLDRAVPQRILFGGASPGLLSLGLAMMLIGIPLWLLHWRYLQRKAREDPVEVESPLRKLYLYTLLGVGGALLVTAAVEVLRRLLGVEPFRSYHLAALLVWSAAWAYHWLVESREGQPSEEGKTVRRWYVYLTSTYSLAMLSAGAGFILFLVLRRSYEGWFSLPLLLQRQGPLWGDAMRNALVVAAVGAVVWAWHWQYAGRHDQESTLRQVYLYLVALLGGAVTALVALGILLFGVLRWGLGASDEPTAAMHFRFLPGALASGLVAVALWGYHSAVLQQEARSVQERWRGAKRSYGYLMAGLGLGAVASALITLIPTLLGILVSSARGVLRGDDFWRDPMSLALTLLIIGLPLWSYHWLRLQGQARAGDSGERAALARRILIYLVLGLGVSALLGTAVHVLYLLLRAVLEGTLSLGLLREARWSLGVLVTAALLLPYHWLVLREDQSAGAEQRVKRKAVTVLVGGKGREVVAQIEEALGARVRTLYRLDPEAEVVESPTPEEVQALVQRVGAAVGPKVLLVVDGGAIRVLSYR